jgi:hypothetical protein
VIVLQSLDLAPIAGSIDAPYRPVPLVTVGPVEVSVVIVEGPRGWHRSADHDEVLLVMEGVITIDGADGTAILNEGDLACIPAQAGFSFNSGMRSTVLLIQERKDAPSADGYHTLPPDVPGSLVKRNVALDVRHADAFSWQRTGVVGGYGAFATRIAGTSAPYQVPAGSLVAVVYRGVLDFEGDETSGTVVGSQILLVPGETTVRLRSEHGATVLALARKGAPLPEPVGRRAVGPDAEGAPGAAS